MPAKAMRLTGMSAKSDAVDAGRALEAFTDAASIGLGAREATAESVQAGPMSGVGGRFLPQGSLTRAEAATVLQRLLRESGLID